MQLRDKDSFIKYYNAARNPYTHKGDYGRVFIIAGCEGMTGAAMLCAESAIRTGAGLVYLFAPGKLLPVYEVGCKEAVKIKVGDDKTSFFEENHVAQVVEAIKSAKDSVCVVVGPGLGTNTQTKKFVHGVLAEFSNSNIPVILDADGLNSYKNKLYEERKMPRKLIITPHTGELSRLMGMTAEYINENREEAAKKAAREIGAIVVLKGNESIVCSENPLQEIYINTTGNAGMATGGSGDVLAGILAGLTASDTDKNTCFEITCCGVFIHGLCGDMASAKYGQRAVKAGDLIDMLKEVVLL